MLYLTGTNRDEFTTFLWLRSEVTRAIRKNKCLRKTQCLRKRQCCHELTHDPAQQNRKITFGIDIISSLAATTLNFVVKWGTHFYWCFVWIHFFCHWTQMESIIYFKFLSLKGIFKLTKRKTSRAAFVESISLKVKISLKMGGKHKHIF